MSTSARIRTKLIGLLAGICLLALSAACAAFVWYDRQSYSEAKHDTLTVLIDAVAQSAKGPVAFADPTSAKYVLDTIEREQTALAAAIYLNDGSRLSLWQHESRAFALPQTLEQAPGETGYVGKELHVVRPVEQEGQRLGQLYAVFSTRDIDARTHRFLSIAGVVLLLAFLGAWLAANLGQVIITKPVNKLVEAVTTLQRNQDFSVRAEKVSDDELGLLTDSFNHMVDAIEARDRELASYRDDLERRVEARTRDLDQRNAEMRLVLDNVDQGFATIDCAGELQSERSMAFDRFFAAPDPSARLWDHIERHAQGFGPVLEMGWESVTDGLLPLDLCIEQLPRRLQTDAGMHFDIEYRPIMHGDELDKALVIFTDVSAKVARERQQVQQAETIAIFEGITRDRSAFMDFFHEAERLMLRLLEEPDAELVRVMRDLHTLKGNFGVSRMHAMARRMHEIESRCLETGDGLGQDDRKLLGELWEEFAQRVQYFAGSRDSITLTAADYETLQQLVEDDGGSPELLSFVDHLHYEATDGRLDRLAREAHRLAKGLQVAELQVDTDCGDVRIPPGSGWLWAALTHLVRNCLDHGLQRLRGARQPRLTLRTVLRDGQLQVEVADNGPGIDWEKVRARSSDRGLPSQTQQDLVAALFADGFTTRAEATDVSGRGFGMSAVKSAVSDRHGDIVVDSSAEGTRFTVRVPLDRLTAEPEPQAPTALSA